MEGALPPFMHDGCALALRARGQGEGIVWIQGMGLHGDGWQPQVDAFCRGFRCVTFDNRGMAKSQPAAQTLSIEQMASDVVAIMDHVGLERAHLVGHSMGGLIALATALDHRERVKSLALLCTFADGREVLKPRAEMMWTGLRTMVGTRRMRRLAFLEMVVPGAMLQTRDRDALAAELEPIFGHDLGDRPDVVMAQLQATSRYDATPRLDELRDVVTLVVSAKEDVVAPAKWGRELARRLASSRYVEVEGAHGVPVTHKDEINRLLGAHLRGAE